MKNNKTNSKVTIETTPPPRRDRGRGVGLHATEERIYNPMNAATKTDPTRFQSFRNGSTALPAGTPAPDFALKSPPDQTVRLSEFRGRPVVLVFYPADWSPICGDQVGLYNEMLSEFRDLGAEILGISVDGVWCHTAFARER